MWRSLGITTAVFLPAPLLLSVLVEDPWTASSADDCEPDTTVAYAVVERPDNDQRRPPRPPREAIEACDGRESGQACQFQGRDGQTVDGKCWRPPTGDDLPLACRPNNPPPRPPNDRR